jgi:Tol biopolymer transport system component
VTGASAIGRLTYGGASHPLWSGDSQYLAFQSDRDGELAIYRQRADTPGTAERLTRPEAGQVHVPHAWSRDGNTLLFSVGEKDSFTLHAYSIRDKKVTKFGDVTSGHQLGAVFSPDGQWVAYHSNLTERRTTTVFVRPFPPNTARYQIADGLNPWWSAVGKELLFATGPGNPIRAVPVTISADFRVGRPVAIPRIGVAGFDQVRGRNFDSASDGRLLVVVSAGTTTPAPTTISVVLNWTEELKQRVPTR